MEALLFLFSYCSRSSAEETTIYAKFVLCIPLTSNAEEIERKGAGYHVTRFLNKSGSILRAALCHHINSNQADDVPLEKTSQTRVKDLHNEEGLIKSRSLTLLASCSITIR